MANITLNIEGDLNIYVSEEDGQPDSLYLDGMDGFPETLRIHLEADGEDDESKAEVIYAIPGAAAIDKEDHYVRNHYHSRIGGNRVYHHRHRQNRMWR